MTEDEIIEKAEALPDRFAGRLSESALWSIERMRGGGEYGEMTIELAASLAAHQAPVTVAERDELLELLEAMGMPTDPIAKLNVQSLAGGRGRTNVGSVTEEGLWISPS